MAIAAVLAIWLLILAVVLKTSLDRVGTPTWGNPMGDQAAIEVSRERTVGQEFTAPLPGLYRIDLVLDEVSASGPRPINFHLRSGPDAEEDLWTAKFDAGDAQGTSVHAVQFPPIPTSEDQVYYFFVESPVSAEGDAIAVRYSPGARLEGARAIVDSEPAAGSLQFTTFYSLRPRDKIDFLVSQFAEGRPYFLGSKAFYLVLAFAYGLIVSAFLWQATRAVFREQER